MGLSLRLNEVKNMVSPCETACDIGCDHGFVSIELVRSGRAGRVIACDINEGPLEACKKNVALAGLLDKIDIRLANGLSGIKESDRVDAIIIAGMGGNLMTEILSKGTEIVSKARELVLQPQSEIFLVRSFLRENGFEINKESFVLDAGKYYFIIDAGHAKEVEEAETKDEEFYDNYSEYLIREGNALYKQYLNEQLKLTEGYLSGVKDEPGKKTLNKRYKDLRKALSLMED